MPSILKFLASRKPILLNGFDGSRGGMGMQTVMVILALEMDQRPWALLRQKI